MGQNVKTKDVFDPESLKIDLDLAEGMGERISRRLKRGESLAEMFAKEYNSLNDFDNRDQDSIEFQRHAAFALVLTGMMAIDYMELQGWKFDDEKHTVEKTSDAETKSDLSDAS